jgi:hypothetical protein
MQTLIRFVGIVGFGVMIVGIFLLLCVVVGYFLNLPLRPGAWENVMAVTAVGFTAFTTAVLLRVLVPR